MKRLLLPLLILFMGLGVAVWLSTHKKEQKRARPRPLVRTVSVLPATYRAISPAIRATGRVRALERVELTPEVSGIVEKQGFALQRGERFSAGQILMRIDSRQAELTLQSQVSDMLNALAGLVPELKTDMPERAPEWENFFNQLDATTIPPLPQTQSQREKLLATRYNIFKLCYAAQSQKIIVDKHTLRAPFSGTVEKTQLYPASMARSGVAVATLARTDAVEIECSLPQNDATMVQAGAEVTIVAEGLSRPLSARLHRLSDVVDESMQSVAAFVRLTQPLPNTLRAGSYVSLTINAAPFDSALELPRKALYKDNLIYTLVDKKLAIQKVTPLYVGIDVVYLGSGIEPGTLIITDQLQDAIAGMQVQSIEQMQAASASKEGKASAGDKKSANKKQGRQ